MESMGITRQELEERQRRVVALDRAAALMEAGESQAAAARAVGISRGTLLRWQRLRQEGGDEALVPTAPPGRPPEVTLAPESAADIRGRYVRSNLRRDRGSMTYAARSAAKDTRSPLTGEERAWILAERASKHTLSVSVRRACRGVTGDAAVQDYRDKDTRRLGGLYEPGMLRMVKEPDGSIRRLRPGERQSWDDASINFCCVVPWPWRGDPCSERWGVRVARFQLLAGIDDATDLCVGWGYIWRFRDSYRASDVVATVAHAWSRGYKPERVMFEGGAWQAERTLEFLRLAGVDLVDAKGRPRSKLIEGFWNRLWTPLSEMTNGQIGRFRGEMAEENKLLARCQAGSLDPRTVYPTLEKTLSVIQRGISYCDTERVESEHYGLWVPTEAHKAGLLANPRPALNASVRHLTLRERDTRVIRRNGVEFSALCPLGDERPYHFASENLLAWEGANVWVSFDPFLSPVRAHISLADKWRDFPAGYVIDAATPCTSAAPHVLHDEAADVWRVEFEDGAAAARRIKRRASEVVGRELHALAAGGEAMIGERYLAAPDDFIQQSALLPAGPTQAEAAEAEAENAAAIDFDELERQAGVIAG